MCREVLFEGCAEKGAVDQEVEWDGRRRVKHGLGIENLGEAISSNICELSDKYLVLEELACSLVGTRSCLFPSGSSMSGELVMKWT